MKYTLEFKKQFNKLFPHETLHNITEKKLQSLSIKENLELEQKIKRVEAVNTVLLSIGLSMPN